MAKNDERLIRAKEIILSDPTAGKQRINAILQIEYGEGLRSDTVLKLKRDVAAENPQLLSAFYRTGGVPSSLTDVYQGWRKAGFLPFEARELTVGHGERYKNFDARAVFDSETGQQARAFRTKLIKEQLTDGWTIQQIKQNIIDYYLKGKKTDPWEHIRAEYKPRKKQDFIDYREKLRRRFKNKQRRLLRGK